MIIELANHRNVIVLEVFRFAEGRLKGQILLVTYPIDQGDVLHVSAENCVATFVVGEGHSLVSDGPFSWYDGYDAELAIMERLKLC